MTKVPAVRRSFLVAVLACAGGCAGTAALVAPPQVSLSRVDVTDLDFSRQVFRLGFDVYNPNPFPLPVARVRYGIDLDGDRFATGETTGGFTVPARGDSAFAISVELDLVRSTPRLLYTIRDAARRDIPYTLEGSLGVDIPAARPLRFTSAGEIRLRTP